MKAPEMMKAAEVMETMEVVKAKAAVKVMEAISTIITVVRTAVVAAIIAPGVLGYATTGAGRAQAASAQVCCKCFLISNYWRCGKR
jgi:hypothetical protein